MVVNFKENKMLSWINNKGHFQGIFWTLSASLFSVLCDTSIRLVSSSLPSMQITFFRLFFGTVLLLPIMLYKRKTAFRLKNKLGHFVRVVVGFGAISCWVYGAGQTSLPSITTISFACPLLVLPLAYFFLGEKYSWQRVLAVVVGFFGVSIVAFYEQGVNVNGVGIFSLHTGIVFLFLAAVLFALSDIINKKMVADEGVFSLLFYFYLGTSLIAFIPMLLVWQPMRLWELSFLVVLAFGGISTLYCILKAADATDISSIAPYKYVELIFSMIIGYILFNEIIKVSTILGAVLIIPSALLIGYYEINKEKKQRG